MIWTRLDLTLLDMDVQPVLVIRGHCPRQSALLSGNRNFEGRISPHVRANYLASPPLVVAYALAGSLKIDLYNDPIGYDTDHNPVFMKDIWPTNQEIRETVEECLTPEMFKERYADVFKGTEEWQAINMDDSGKTYNWDPKSTYVKNPPFFEGMTSTPDNTGNVGNARALALLGDSVTTDHISPAGAIKNDGPAGEYLQHHGVPVASFNSFGARRGNHEVMMRGTFANVRIRNLMLDDVEGGYTKHIPSGKEMSIYDAAMTYEQEGTPLVIIAGKEYGTGSSRDWAAKGTRLLGVKAVIAESFERIHRSNLVGMGVLPLVFKEDGAREKLNLDGSETFDLNGLDGDLTPNQDVTLTVTRADGNTEEVALKSRIDTIDEIGYYQHGGILHYVLRDLAS